MVSFQWHGHSRLSPQSQTPYTLRQALVDGCARVESFPPGHAYDSKAGTYPATTTALILLDGLTTPPMTDDGKGGLVRWYNPVWWDPAYLPSERVDLLAVRSAFETVGGWVVYIVGDGLTGSGGHPLHTCDLTAN